MTNEHTPEPVPVAPENEPEQIFPSATGVVIPDEEARDAVENKTGE